MMMNDDTFADNTATFPTCGLTGCGVKVSKGGLCTGCRSINYCSKEHQRKDWPSHKLKCCPIKKYDNEEKDINEQDVKKENYYSWPVSRREVICTYR